jgi:Tfp pilus assembly protein PilX
MNRKNSMGSFRNRQQGVVLLIALTVLVAMSLAGVALMRSVDNTVVIAGNLAFKQASLQVADNGTQAAVGWLANNSAGTGLYNTNESLGYFSARPSDEPDWFGTDVWAQSAVLNLGVPDPQGNTIRYVIHRMCDHPDSAYDESCMLFYPKALAGNSSSKQTGAPAYEGFPQIYYRVTSRVEGPRNNVTVIQTSVLVQG